MKLRLAITLLIVLILAVACGGDSSPQTGDITEGAGSSAPIAGDTATFRVTISGGDARTLTSENGRAVLDGEVLFFQEVFASGDTQTAYTLSIVLPEEVAAGTYPVYGLLDSWDEGEIAVVGYYAIITNAGGTNTFQNWNENGSGSMTITSLSDTAISGSFEFTVEAELDGEPVTVSGEFTDVPVSRSE